MKAPRDRGPAVDWSVGAASLALLIGLGLWAWSARGAAEQRAARARAVEHGAARTPIELQLEAAPAGAPLEASLQPGEAPARLPIGERAELLARMHLTVRVENSAGLPIPGVVLQNGGHSWGDNFDFVTDRDGVVVLPRPTSRVRFEQLERRLPFDGVRLFPLERAELRGEQLVLVMDDIELYRVRMFDERGVPVPAEQSADLTATVGGSEPRLAKRVELSDGLWLPVLAGARSVVALQERLVGALELLEREPAPDPGPVASPTVWEVRAEQPEIRVEAQLAGVGATGLEVVAWRSWMPQHSTVQAGRGGRAVMEFEDLRVLTRGEQNLVEGLDITARRESDGAVLLFRFRPNSPLSAGYHDLGVLQPVTEPPLVSGRVLDLAGQPLGDVVVIVAGESDLGDAARTTPTPHGLHDWNGVWSSRSGRDGRFRVLGSADRIESPVLLAFSKGLRYVEPIRLRPGAQDVVLRVGAPERVRLGWRFADPALRGERAQVSVTRIGGAADGVPILSRNTDREVLEFTAVAGPYELRIDGGAGSRAAVVLRGDVVAGSGVRDGEPPFVEGWEDVVVQ